jgi:hypothetical protein
MLIEREGYPRSGCYRKNRAAQAFPARLVTRRAEHQSASLQHSFEFGEGV